MFLSSRRQRLWITSLNLAASLLLLLTLALAASVQAQADIPTDFGLKQTAEKAGLPVSNSVSPVAVASTIINTLLSLVGVIALIVIIYAGFTWLTSAGNEEKVTKAKKLLASAVIGVAIILGAYAITSFVVKTLSDAAKSSGTVTSCSSHPGGTCMTSSTSSLVPYTQEDCPSGQLCCANAP
jgi:hypothetical protein